MTTSSKTEDSFSNKKTIFQKHLKTEGKSTTKKGISYVKNRTVIVNPSGLPMAPFKGTKFYLEKLEETDESVKSKIKETDESVKSKRKRKSGSDLTDELCMTKEKKSKYDPLKVMSKLEQFSEVWNDCPNVENPKSNFEIVPNNGNETETFKFEKGTKSSVKTEGENLSNKIKKTKNVKEFKEHKDYNQTDSNKRKSRIELSKNFTNDFKNKVIVNGPNDLDITSKPLKYDSKLADMKRKKAVQEQSQLHADKKNIIKKALSSTDGKQQINKKIFFSDAEEDNEDHKNDSNQTNNQKLFEDDDSSDGDLELKVNSQFEGKKGQKLLELQSKFASDSRFTLDSRFHDSESDNEDKAPTENLDANEEKKRQLEILESIVKQPIRPLSESKNLPVKKYDESLMVRFDPTREDHQKYLLKPQKPSEETKVTEPKIKKPKKEKNPLPNAEENRPLVSSEKVYAVKENLKEVLKKESKTEFSLLKLFGSKEEESNTQVEGSESVKKLKYATKNPFRYDSSESESEEEESRVEEKEQDKSVAKPNIPSWRTTFFFTDNDSRWKEAEEFLKGPEELEGDQEFAEKRKMLKDFIRHKVKNNNRKKDPFKKKLGGIKKKTFNKKKGK